MHAMRFWLDSEYRVRRRNREFFKRTEWKACALSPGACTERVAKRDAFIMRKLISSIHLLSVGWLVGLGRTLSALPLGFIDHFLWPHN